MTDVINKINSRALALRDVHRNHGNFLSGFASLDSLSKAAPFYGFVNVTIDGCVPFTMFSNNDDFVARSIFWYGSNSYEPMSLKIWLSLAKNSKVIFDIGSYTGIYSLAAAGQNSKCKIHGFEALDSIYFRLLVNKLANSFGNIEVHNLAISENDLGADFNVFAGDAILSSGSSIMEKDGGRPIHRTKKVPSSSIDILVNKMNLKFLDLIKIDAEGAEHLIFKGGEKVLANFKPDIICEFLQGARTEEIEPILERLGYNYFHIHEKSMTIEPVKSIVFGKDMDSLNTLITQKSANQIEEILAMHDLNAQG